MGDQTGGTNGKAGIRNLSLASGMVLKHIDGRDLYCVQASLSSIQVRALSKAANEQPVSDIFEVTLKDLAGEVVDYGLTESQTAILFPQNCSRGTRLEGAPLLEMRQARNRLIPGI